MGADQTTIQEKIAQKAYEHFEARGRQHGFAMEDWILAEQEVMGGSTHITKSKEKQIAKETMAVAKQSSQRQLSGVRAASFA